MRVDVSSRGTSSSLFLPFLLRSQGKKLFLSCISALFTDLSCNEESRRHLQPIIINMKSDGAEGTFSRGEGGPRHD